MLCTINNQRAYTDDAKVKITKENYMVKNRQTWSMNITFPLSIPENRAVFGHVNRIDVLKRKTTFPNCRLYAANKLVIAGKGTVTEFTETAVKLQIKSGKDEYRYDRYAPSYYIDQLKYEGLLQTSWVTMDTLPVPTHLEDFLAPTFAAILEMSPNRYRATLVPVYDSANGKILNQPCYKSWVTRAKYNEQTHQWEYEYAISYAIARPAVQPNLWHVVITCITRLGYTFSAAQSQVFNEYRYVAIANAVQTMNIADALPHWSIQRLLDEVENLFNVTFFFDETTRTCSLVDNASVDEQTCIVKNEDDFTASYEEDGLKDIMSSDIRFNLSDEHVYSDIPDSMFEKYDYLEFPTRAEMFNAFEALSDEKKMKVIYACPDCFITGMVNDYDPDTEDDDSVGFRYIGNLQHIRRSEGEQEGEEENSSVSTIDINLAPVFVEPTTEVERDTEENLEFKRGILHAGAFTQSAIIPQAPEEKVNTDSDTVMGELEGVSTTQEEAERLEIFVYFPDRSFEYRPTTVPGRYRPEEEAFAAMQPFRIPCFMTDYGFDQGKSDGFYQPNQGLSLAINRDASPHLGRYHAKSRRVENHIQLVARFLYNGIPDPTATYVFAGKAYLCEKIEIEIEADRILPLKTGYFYEIL